MALSVKKSLVKKSVKYSMEVRRLRTMVLEIFKSLNDLNDLNGFNDLIHEKFI